jgi:kynurenine formamidase
MRLAPAGANFVRIVDLTYPLAAKYPAWPGDATPFAATANAGIAKDGYFTRRISFLEHFGTHLDAPAHFAAGQATVEKIAPEKLFGPAVLLDIRAAAARNPDYLAPVTLLEEWERKHGRIPAGAIVLLRTGWAARWPDQTRYRNMDAAGVMHFPGFSVAAVQALLERKVVGLGIDALSVDFGASRDYAVHRLSHGAGLYHLENLADLGALPEAGASLIVAPIKLEGGSGGPARVFALLP